MNDKMRKQADILTAIMKPGKIVIMDAKHKETGEQIHLVCHLSPSPDGKGDDLYPVAQLFDSERLHDYDLPGQGKIGEVVDREEELKPWEVNLPTTMKA